MNDYLLKKQTWRLWVVIVILILAGATVKKYQKVAWTKPTITIDTTFAGSNICYRLHKGWNDYVSVNTIFTNGLLDFDTTKSTTEIAFVVYDRIKSIRGYCEVLNGSVRFNDQTIAYTGGQKDFWDERIPKNYIEEGEKYAGLRTAVISIPLTKNDLYKQIRFVVQFNVVYPKLSSDKNKYFNKEESFSKVFDIYTISQEEMKAMKEYTMWKNRGFHKAIFFVLAAITTILICIVVFYKRKELMYALKK